MLQHEQIFHIINENDSPYWKLFLREALHLRPKLVANYGGDDLNDKESKKDKDRNGMINRSIEVLQAHLNVYKNTPGLSFEIEMRPTPTSNGEKVYGPYQFEITPAFPQGSGVPGSGVAGIGNVPGFQGNMNLAALGMVSKDQVTDMLALAGEKSALMVEKALFERDKRDLAEERKAFEEEAKDIVKEHSDLSEIMRKASQKGITEAAIKGLKLFVNGDLDGILSGERKNEAVEQTPEEMKIQEFAEYLLSEELTVDEMEGMFDVFKKLIAKHKENKVKSEE